VLSSNVFFTFVITLITFFVCVVLVLVVLIS